MDVKGKVLLQFFNKRKLRNETKSYLEQIFFSIIKFEKLGFSAPLNKWLNLLNQYFSTCVLMLYL